MKICFSTAAVLGLLAAPALAGDPAPATTIVPLTVTQTTDWTGPYVGLRGTIATSGGTSFQAVGAQAGYLYDLGNVVVGGEVSYDRFFSPGSFNQVSADALLGYDAGQVMPFVSLGASYTEADDFGFSAGAGVNFMATDNVMLTARYRYIHFPDAGTDVHQGIAAISYKF